jgi:probable HAF family extracellular repeat protein
MQGSWRSLIAACALLGAAACDVSPQEEPETAQAEAAAEPKHKRRGYHVIKLRSLGGTASGGNSINNLSWVTGTSTRADNAKTRATLWLFGLKLDLGTLGGPSSGVIWPVKNNIGVISGIAQTAELDPYGEDWSCSAFLPDTGHVCRGFVWERGRMRALPTFGGTHGFATGTNNRRETVGWAENTVRDSTCVAPQIFQFRAALWGPGPDQMRELPPLGDDRTSAATAINDRGQVVGISGDCGGSVGSVSADHALLWEDGVPTDLGDLGADYWNTPMAINERTEVVGFANNPALADPPTRFRPLAFLWTEADGMRSLGTLSSDPQATSQGLGINNRGQVVGLSCLSGACSAYLWEDGVMTDLNTLVTSGDREHLFYAGDINDFGVITGQSVSADDVTSSFIAIPLP